MRLSRNQVAFLIDNINEPLKKAVLRQIDNSRENEARNHEFELSAAEISSVINETLDDTRDRLEYIGEKTIIVDKDGVKHEITDSEELSKLEETETKVAKSFNDFASSLQNQTKTDEEISRSDAKELSENEKAFRGNEQPNRENKSKYEAMFK